MGVASFLGEAVRTGVSLVQGLGVTLREMVLEDPVTVQYPEERPEVPAWFRGIPVQKTDLATGEYKCTSCGMCVEACPVNVITLEWHTDENKKKVVDRYAIDMSRCMLCNYCIEACPFDSLVMAYDYELCKINPENLVYEFEDLLKIGLKYSKADEVGPKPKGGNPPWVFAELTNASEADILDPKGYLGRHPLPPKTRKEYVEKLYAELRGGTEGAQGAREAAQENRVTPQAAAHTITKDAPTQAPVENPNPKNVSAAAGPAHVAAPKADVAAPQEAGEVAPDQQPKQRDGGEVGDR